MRAGQGGRGGVLWAVIAVLCTGLGAVLFLTTTVPALRERAWLREVEDAHAHLRADLTRQLTELQTRDAALTWDPQTILLAIDEAGLTPGELLGETVAGMPATPAWSPAPR